MQLKKTLKNPNLYEKVSGRGLIWGLKSSYRHYACISKILRKTIVNIDYYKNPPTFSKKEELSQLPT